MDRREVKKGRAMIKSVLVRNYRGIRNCRLENLKRVNVFIGRNNSGKSSLLESLYLASAAFYLREELSKKVTNKIDYLLNRRCYRGYNWNNAKEVLWYEYDVESPIFIELSMESKQDATKVIRISLFDWHPHPVVKHQFGDHDYICFIHKYPVNSQKKLEISDISPTGEIQKYDEVRTFFSNFKFIGSTLVQEMDVVEKKLWKDLLKKRLDKLVVEVLREGYEIEVEDLTYTTYDGETYQLAVKLPWTSIRVDDLGDGARYAILLIMIAALSKNTALLIEEPENHQHPSGLARSLDMFLSLVKQNNIQVFITTHSLEFLRLLRKISEERKIDVGIYFLERDKQGRVDVRELTSENIDVLERMGFDPRFLDLI